MERTQKIKIDFTDVESSNISSVHFFHGPNNIKTEGHLIIKFKSGEEYKYSNVPLDEVYWMMKAESVGKYFIQKIRNNYTFVKLNL